MTVQRPALHSFLIALLLAPVVFGGAAWLFTLMGEYGARFARVGILGLLIVLPAYLVVFAPLAWRALAKGAAGIPPFVFAGLWANAASLLIFPVLVLLTPITALDEVPIETTSPIAAALFAGFGAFFLGLFFMPPVTALFGWFAGKFGAGSPQ